MSKQNKCEGCPFAAIDEEHVDEHEEDADDLIKESVSPDLDEFIERALKIAEHLTEIGSVDLSPFADLTPEELAIALRANMGESLAIINAHIAEIKAEKAAREAKCIMGALTFRATQGNERVTISVCQNPEVSDEKIQPAIVKRVQIT